MPFLVSHLLFFVHTSDSQCLVQVIHFDSRLFISSSSIASVLCGITLAHQLLLVCSLGAWQDHSCSFNSRSSIALELYGILWPMLGRVLNSGRSYGKVQELYGRCWSYRCCKVELRNLCVNMGNWGHPSKSHLLTKRPLFLVEIPNPLYLQ